MTAEQFKAAIAALDLSQVGAARLFGVNDRTARRWASGKADVPKMVALLLRLMVRHHVSVASAERLVESPLVHLPGGQDSQQELKAD